MRPDWVEADRLATLQMYDILDASPKPEFDDFVQIAAHVCQTPIAVVNLIDETRQVFAGEIGLGIRQTPLDISICARAILQPDMFVIPDLSNDSRFDCNPLVTGAPYLRFYGGALIETPSGLPLGTVCVLDYEPRPSGLTSRQASTLQALARQVMTNLELRRTVSEMNLMVLEAHHRVKNSLQMLQSLMTLQARMSKHEEAAQQLRESAARIHTFGAMHEHLYSAGASIDVNLADYLRKVGWSNGCPGVDAGKSEYRLQCTGQCILARLRRAGGWISHNGAGDQRPEIRERGRRCHSTTPQRRDPADGVGRRERATGRLSSGNEQGSWNAGDHWLASRTAGPVARRPNPQSHLLRRFPAPVAYQDIVHVIA